MYSCGKTAMCSVHRRFSGPEKKRCISKFFNLFCDFPSFFFNTRLWICSSYQIYIIKGLRKPFLQTVTKLALNGVIKVLGLIPLHICIGLPRLCKSQSLWRKQMHFKTSQSYVLSISSDDLLRCQSLNVKYYLKCFFDNFYSLLKTEKNYW